MFVIKLISRLPFPVLYALSDFFFVVSFHLVKYRRKLVWKNLKNSFPEKSEDELRTVLKFWSRDETKNNSTRQFRICKAKE